jgi:predicted small lipoprotein YifL
MKKFQVMVTLVGIFVLSSLLTGCGGPSNPEAEKGTPAPNSEAMKAMKAQSDQGKR